MIPTRLERTAGDASIARRRCSPMPQRGPLGSALRANPFPEVTDLFCRLPLSTLFYQLEATHLGDLMRLWVRTRSHTQLRLFKGRRERTERQQNAGAFRSVYPYLRANRFQGHWLLNKKR